MWKGQNKEAMIAFFDSGVGGLCSMRMFREHLPAHDFLYFGDTADGPYGDRSLDLIQTRVRKGLEMLKEEGAVLILVLCGSAAGVLRTSGAELDARVLDGIGCAARAAVKISKKGRIGVIGSRALIRSRAYETALQEIRPDVSVLSRESPLVVPLLESGWSRKPEARMIVKKYLHPLKIRQIDALIPGDSHYPFIRRLIQEKIGKRAQLIDPAECLAEKLKVFLADRPDLDREISKNGRFTAWVSDLTPAVAENARMFYGKRLDLRCGLPGKGQRT